MADDRSLESCLAVFKANTGWPVVQWWGDGGHGEMVVGYWTKQV